MSSGCDVGGDLSQMQGHRSGIAPRQDQSRGLAFLRADRTEDVGRGGSLILWGRRPGAAPRPTPGDLVLLSSSGLIGEPDLYVRTSDALLVRDSFQ